MRGVTLITKTNDSFLCFNAFLFKVKTRYFANTTRIHENKKGKQLIHTRHKMRVKAEKRKDTAYKRKQDEE